MAGQIYRFTPLMKGVLAALLENGGEMTPMEIAAKMNLALPDDAPMIGSQTLTGPMRQLRIMKLAKRRKFQNGTRNFATGEYPVFVRQYSIPEAQQPLCREILAYLGDDQTDMSENEMIGIKYMLSLRNTLKENDALTDAQVRNAVVEATYHATIESSEPYVEHRDPFFRYSKIWNKTKDAPYMLRVWIGRLRLHIFYRGDLDPDCHDHPWDFKTFPFTPYVEYVEVDPTDDKQAPQGFYNVVPAWRWSYRKAEHRHRVIGPYSGFMELTAYKDDTIHQIPVPADDASRFARDHKRWKPGVAEGKIVTLVWRGRYRRMWGFWKSRFGKWCWINYRKYIWEGGKDAPCNDD